MKRYLALTASLAFMLTVAGPSMAKPSSAADSKAANSVSHGDKSWVVDTYKGGAEEVRLGQLAATKGSNASVKAFGQHMVADHSKADQELKELADKKGIKIDTKDSQSDKDYAKLNALSGVAFDKAYVGMMVDGHKKVAASFKKESTGGNDDNIKGWATKILPTIQHHLEMAQSIQAKVGK